jgi:hypothetical protein
MAIFKRPAHSAVLLGMGITLALGASERNVNAQQAQTDNDVTRSEIASFDVFLDAHPDINKDLRTNPSLIHNTDYLEDHPQLQGYLSQHPRVQEEIRENPSYFMHREKRFDAQEPGRGNPNPDLTRREVANMDGFLDAHPDIDKQLRADPSLINNGRYLQDHPQLQAYLSDHPAVREEFKENPNYFMHRANRFDAQEPGRGSVADRDRDSDRERDRDRVAANRDRDDADRDRVGTNRDVDRDRDVDRSRTSSRNVNPDLTNGEVASMDQFLDDHKNIAKDLEKKPDLVNNDKYLKHHKDLENYLSGHPAVREEVKENPSYFMRRENRFDARENDRTVVRSQNPELDKKEVREMDQFLDKHKKIAKDLEKQPSLANDSSYLKHHKELQSFLATHNDVGQELKANPSRVMQRQAQLEQSRSLKDHNQLKPKTKLEEKENIHATPPH